MDDAKASCDVELPVLAVSQLAEIVRDGLHSIFPDDLWVEGQISGFHDARSGHAYFDLIEPSDVPGRPIAARFSVALFKGDRIAIDQTLIAAGGLTLANDLLIRLRARLEFYGPHGKLQLVMHGVDPSFTLGRLAAERDRLLRSLSDEGLLRANRSIPIPVPPLRIGLVTSLGSAAHADFADELARSGLPFNVLECDAQVQGDGAPVGLAEAIRTVATYRPDVVAVVRGGGSAADLATFDAEVLARTIAALDIAVVTGIGHEVDRSVADEVSHTSFKTPTACAAALVEQVRSYDQTVNLLAKAVAERARAALGRSSDRVGELADRIAGTATSTLQRLGDQLDIQFERLWRAPTALLDRHGDRLDSAESHLRALDPARILARGWSITRQSDGALVRSVDGIVAGTTLLTTLVDGRVTSTVGLVSTTQTVEDNGPGTQISKTRGAVRE
ncbi:MAG TPA: exodeoxyribonuclease VII large subunit [Acidimicrobiaceae bacterium]|nr:exodeoxyribonuclease VII large subunit [Acidimicrobiaceae bacterium]